MKTVTINKKELLDILYENRIKHAEQYDEAVKDYKAVIMNFSKANIKSINASVEGGTFSIKQYPSYPPSYISEYDQVIRMIELDVNDTITLDKTDFNNYVLDNWGWKQTFTQASTVYKNLVSQ